MNQKLIYSLALLTLFSATGCKRTNSVLASTGTIIGVDISQNPQTQFYEAKLGYNRGELAFVPTNRRDDGEEGSDEMQGNGAKDTTDVLMELKYGKIFSISNGGIYQRLAVGSTAVKQPGAAFMFARDEQGDLDADTAESVSRAVNAEPAFTSPISYLAAGRVIAALQEVAKEDPEAKLIVGRLDALPVPQKNEHPLYKFAVPNELDSFAPQSQTYTSDYKGYVKYRGQLTDSVNALESTVDSIKNTGPIKLHQAGGAAINIPADKAFDLKLHLEDQRERLLAAQRAFATNTAVLAALDHFSKISKR